MITSENHLPQALCARKSRKIVSTDGGTFVDDYAWLEDSNDPEVLAHLDLENRYACDVLRGLNDTENTLHAELLSHVREDEEGVPVFDRGFWYQWKSRAGMQYGTLYRRRGHQRDEEVAILDVNEIAAGHKFAALRTSAVTENGQLLAYVVDAVGNRENRLFLKDLYNSDSIETGPPGVGSIAWAADGKTLFYTVEDQKKRQHRLCAHTVGERWGQDRFVLEEQDERFNIRLLPSRDHKYLFLFSESHTTTEQRFLRSKRPLDEWRILFTRRQGIRYWADHRASQFFVCINDTSQSFRLAKLPIGQNRYQDLVEVVPARDQIVLYDFELFERFVALFTRFEGLTRLEILNFRSSTTHDVTFPESAYVVSSEPNPDFRTKQFRYSYQSLASPKSVYELDVDSGISRLLKRFEIPNYRPDEYASERIWFTSTDGTRVPISIVYKRNLFSPGKNPLYVHSYGAYGIPVPPTFGTYRTILLDRGVVMAYPHIRGGGELGETWHEAGRLQNKRNSITDFICAVQFLISEAYGAENRIAIEGVSAGGLVIGAALNLCPHLFELPPQSAHGIIRRLNLLSS